MNTPPLTIQKARETMTARERVMRTLAFEPADRVPIDYAANPTIHGRLMNAMGAKNNEALLHMLGVDFRSLGVRYTGPTLFQDIPGRQVDPQYGVVSRWVENIYGGYQDFCDYPLQDAEEGQMDAWPMPNPDHYDYEEAVAQAQQYRDMALCVGGAGYPDVINSLGRVMGMETCLINLQMRDEETLRFIRRKTDFELGIVSRLIDALHKAGEKPLLMILGEDLGTQHTPMISLELFRAVIRPAMQRFIDLAKSHDLAVMVHSCGSSSWAYEDYIDMGVRVVDTLQPEATNMSPEYLAANFGGRLGFHGCISTAAIANLTAAGVEKHCADTLRIMMPTGGYFFAPTHMIQDNTPVENIIMMYQTAHRAGVYGRG